MKHLVQQIVVRHTAALVYVALPALLGLSVHPLASALGWPPRLAWVPPVVIALALLVHNAWRYARFLEVEKQGFSPSLEDRLHFLGHLVLLPIVTLTAMWLVHHQRWATGVAAPAMLLAAGGTYLACSIFCFGLDDGFVRGAKILTQRKARAIAERVRPPHDAGILFGGVPIPSSAANTHFLVLGTIGAGKTLTMRLLMQEALPRIGAGRDQRALVYDAKQDTLSVLHGLGLSYDIVTLHPFDVRGYRWAIARDIRSAADAETLATILIPENAQGRDPYFETAARTLVEGVVKVFLKTAPGVWDLRDVVTALGHEERLKAVLHQTTEGRELFDTFFAKPSTALDILSTIRNKVNPYRTIAACWDHAENELSLADWLAGEMVLVLGNSHTLRPAVKALNRLIFKRLSQLVLDQDDSESRRSWFFLDEVRHAGHLDGLSDLMVQGRSRGACCVLGLQEKKGLSEVYGDHVADEILGQARTKAILPLEDPDLAQWAARLIGTNEVMELQETDGSHSNSVSQQRVERDVLLPSQLLYLPNTSRRRGLSGYFKTPEVGFFWGAHLTSAFLRRELKPPDARVANFIARPAAHQELRPWDEADLRRLGLPIDLVDPRPRSATAPPGKLPPLRKVFDRDRPALADLPQRKTA